MLQPPRRIVSMVTASEFHFTVKNKEISGHSGIIVVTAAIIISKAYVKCFASPPPKQNTLSIGILICEICENVFNDNE